MRADNPLQDVTVRRSGRARRMTLRVSRLDGRVTLTLPRGVSEREAAGVVRTKADWIAAAKSGVDDAVTVEIGANVPVEGRFLPVRQGVSRRAVVTVDRIEAPALGAGGAIAEALKALARARVEAAAARYAALVGRELGRVSLRDTRSRWGSCSADGNLMLSWRLVMAPPAVLDYVVAHEAAHLVEMNHSPDFWALVARICPEFSEHKVWLRQNGAGLHRYRFD
ncbi:MAG: SprT family zinc-dependent metalloprotease [Pseudomonadota bacterium]